MSSLVLRMLIPLTLLAATGIPVDPACASVPAGTGNCGRGEIRDVAKHAKDTPAPAPGKYERHARMEAL